jgi:hypothetical protein
VEEKSCLQLRTLLQQGEMNFGSASGRLWVISRNRWQGIMRRDRVGRKRYKQVGRAMVVVVETRKTKGGLWPTQCACPSASLPTCFLVRSFPRFFTRFFRLLSFLSLSAGSQALPLLGHEENAICLTWWKIFFKTCGTGQDFLFLKSQNIYLYKIIGVGVRTCLIR